MNDKTKELHELTKLFERYSGTLKSYLDVFGDKSKFWCRENTEIEVARENAENAMRVYTDLLSELYHVKENELGDKLYQCK